MMMMIKMKERERERGREDRLPFTPRDEGILFLELSLSKREVLINAMEKIHFHFNGMILSLLIYSQYNSLISCVCSSLGDCYQSPDSRKKEKISRTENPIRMPFQFTSFSLGGADEGNF